MASAFSMDLRKRLAAGVDGGSSCHVVAARFSVSASCVIKLMQHLRDDGTLEPRKTQRRQPALAAHYDRIRALVAQRPDATIDELQARLAEEGIVTSRSPLGRCLLALGLTRKKRPVTPPSRRAPMSPPPARPGARRSRS